MGWPLSLLGAALGAWLWLPVLSLKAPVNLAALAALLCGVFAGLGMRLGKRPRPLGAAALAVAASLAGRYAAFVKYTAYFTLATREKLAPGFWDPRCVRYFLKSRFLSPESPWDLAFSLIYLALAGYAAWKVAAPARPRP